jgi:membrane-bound serine protease (ClpP class)
MIAFLAAGLLLASPAPRVEVVQVEGIIDAPTQRAILATLREAERERADALVIEIDSRGEIGSRVLRIKKAIESARVPVVTWVGPPGARAELSAALLVTFGDVASMAPGTSLGLLSGDDLRNPLLWTGPIPSEGPYSAQDAQDRGKIAFIALSIPDLLDKLDGREVHGRVLHTDGAIVTLHKLDMLGRVQHGVSKPSIAYLLLLLGLVGLVFEAFHPSRGPAGASGAFALALAAYGIATLHGSWLGVALIVLGVISFCVDLRFQSLGLFSGLGFAGLVVGSILLWPSPMLRASPWVLGIGIAGMVSFLLGAMTRVLRDLRALASGEIQPKEAHPHE